MTTDTKISQRMNRPLAEVDPEIAEFIQTIDLARHERLSELPQKNFSAT